MRKRLLMLGTVGVTVLALGLWFLDGPGLTLGIGGEPSLVISPDHLEFDATVVGTSSTGYVVATNMGEEPIMVGRVRAEGAFKAPPGFSLEPGTSAPVTVVFEPGEVGPAKGRLVLESDAFRGGEFAVALSGEGQGLPQIAIEPLFLNFGAVALGSEVRGLVTIHNPGEGPLRVTPPGTGDFTPEVSDLLVAPGAAERVEFRFRPSQVGRQEMRLEFRNNAVNGYGMFVQMSGTGLDAAAQPAIEVSPGSLDFGEVRVGSTARRRLVVRNVGSDPLDIVNLAFPSEEFQGSSRSRRIPVGGHLSFPITFAPKSTGARFAPLVIYSNDPDAGVLTVAMVGAGSLTATTGSEETETGSDGSVAFLGNDGGGSLDSPQTDSEGDPSPGDSADPVDPADAADFQARVVEGKSRIGLQQHFSDLLEFDFEVDYNPNTGSLRIRGIPPTIDFPLGQPFYLGEVEGHGFVDPDLGDATVSMTVPVIDRFGNTVMVPVDLTTGVSKARDENNIEVTAQGDPLDPATGLMTLKERERIPPGGPLETFLLSWDLELQLPPKN